MHNFKEGDTFKLKYKATQSSFLMDEIELTLTHEEHNNVSMKHVFFLVEQMFILIKRLDSKIPNENFIKHHLVEVGYNY